MEGNKKDFQVTAKNKYQVVNQWGRVRGSLFKETGQKLLSSKNSSTLVTSMELSYNTKNNPWTGV